MAIDPKQVANLKMAMDINWDGLMQGCLEYTERRPLTENHRFVVSPVKVEIVNGTIKLHRHADITLSDSKTPNPRVIVQRAVETVTEVPRGG